MEYANLNIINLDEKYELNNNLVKAEIESYRNNKEIKKLIVDENFRLIENHESFVAGKKLGLKFMKVQRKKFYIDKNNVFPSALLIELTNRCNYHCKMCPRNQLTRSIVDMDIEIFKKIIDEVSNHKIEGLWLYNIGESLLHPNFFEMLDYVSKFKSIRPLWLSTNGSTLSKKTVDKLVISDINFINVSLNALDKETHEKITKVPNYEQVIKNLNYLIDQKNKINKKKPFLRVQIIDLPEMYGRIDEFINEWGPKVDIISINELEKFIGQKEIPTNKEINETKSKNLEPCKRIDRGFLYIFSNNKVGICATDFNCVNCVGDISEKSISEVWTGTKYKKLFDNIKRQNYDEIPFCYACKDKHLA